jgi:hypothetical protein
LSREKEWDWRGARGLEGEGLKEGVALQEGVGAARLWPAVSGQGRGYGEEMELTCGPGL